MRDAPGVTTVLSALLSALHRAWSLTLGRVLGWALIGLIRFYQLVISPLTPPTCRFHPSCSAYALGSVRRHGPVKGLLLSAWRVLRCNPWNAGGLDPVPPAGAWRPEILPDGRPRTPAATHETLSADESHRNPDCAHGHSPGAHRTEVHRTGVHRTGVHHTDVHHTTALGA